MSNKKRKDNLTSSLEVLAKETADLGLLSSPSKKMGPLRKSTLLFNPTTQRKKVIDSISNSFTVAELADYVERFKSKGFDSPLTDWIVTNTTIVDRDDAMRLLHDFLDSGDLSPDHVQKQTIRLFISEFPQLESAATTTTTIPITNPSNNATTNSTTSSNATSLNSNPRSSQLPQPSTTTTIVPFYLWNADFSNLNPSTIPTKPNSTSSNANGSGSTSRKNSSAREVIPNGINLPGEGVYHGELEGHNVRSGRGRLAYSGGETYEGEWKNDQW